MQILNFKELMMKILVTGVKGQLGYDVLCELKRRNYQDVLGIDIADLDITKEIHVKDYITKYNPQIVVHCAAYTAVDLAEDKKEVAYDINVNGTSFIAHTCQKIKAKMIYISTDYVFNGEGVIPFEVTDEAQPINYYGLTKYLGEHEVKRYLDDYFIIRTSWVFGAYGNNFVKTMLKLGKVREELNVVSDQIGSPTYTHDLSKLICDMIETNKYGIYQATNEGVCSWYEFACEIFKQAGIEVVVNPILSDAYPTNAQRPKNSRLSKKSLTDNGFSLLPDWQSALTRYLDQTK